MLRVLVIHIYIRFDNSECDNCSVFYHVIMYPRRRRQADTQTCQLCDQPCRLLYLSCSLVYEKVTLQQLFVMIAPSLLPW